MVFRHLAGLSKVCLYANTDWLQLICHSGRGETGRGGSERSFMQSLHSCDVIVCVLFCLIFAKTLFLRPCSYQCVGVSYFALLHT